VFENGGSGLIGNKGRKTANVCDKHARETSRNTVTDFTGVAFIILLRKTGRKVPQDVPKRGPVNPECRSLPLIGLEVIYDRLQCGFARFSLCAHFAAVLSPNR
jgi:hypothetical protein